MKTVHGIGTLVFDLEDLLESGLEKLTVSCFVST